MSTRREVLAGVGLVSALSAGVRPVSAQETVDWKAEAPDHVEFAYDKDWLADYRPRLVTRDVSMANVLGLFGMKATSPNWDVEVGIYAMSYATQDGWLAPPISDSHYGDHEWVYCFVKDGEVVECVYTAYHWIAGKVTGDAIPTDKDGRPKLHIIAPWHNYRLTEDSGVLVDLDDLEAAFQSWLDNGMAEHLYLPCVTRPVLMRTGGRNHWWQSGIDAQYAQLLYKIGFQGADKVDPEID